jgi:hypothetical protein
MPAQFLLLCNRLAVALQSPLQLLPAQVDKKKFSVCGESCSWSATDTRRSSVRLGRRMPRLRHPMNLLQKFFSCDQSLRAQKRG